MQNAYANFFWFPTFKVDPRTHFAFNCLFILINKMPGSKFRVKFFVKLFCLKIGGTFFHENKIKFGKLHWLQLFTAKILKFWICHVIIVSSRIINGWFFSWTRFWSSRSWNNKFKLKFLQQNSATNAIFRIWFYFVQKICRFFKFQEVTLLMGTISSNSWSICRIFHSEIFQIVWDCPSFSSGFSQLVRLAMLTNFRCIDK